MATRRKRRTSKRRTSRRAAPRRRSRRRVSRRRVSRNKARRRTSRRVSSRKRFILRVKPYHRKETNGWAVVRSGRKTPLSFHRMKSVAVKRARSKAKAEWKKGRKAQIVVYKRNGQIAYERTYGLDPRRTKG